MKLRKLMKKIPFDVSIKIMDMTNELSVLFEGTTGAMPLVTYLYNDYKVIGIRGVTTDKNDVIIVIFVEEQG